MSNINRNLETDTSILAGIREIIEMNAYFAQHSAWDSSEFFSQVGYCRADSTAGHYVLFENYSDYSYTRGWWWRKRSITIENKGCDISFSGTTRHDNGDWLTNYFRISDERVSAFCQKYQVELAPTEEIRDIVILRLFDRLYVAPPNGRPQQRLGRKSQNPSGRFQGAEGFHALATEIDASVTPDPEYMLKNKTTTLTQLYYTGTIRKTIDDLTYALHLRYDYSLALRSNVTRSPSEELGEMTLQEVPERATRFDLSWTPWRGELSELLAETMVQETLTTLTSTLAAYGYHLVARPLVLTPDTEDPWAEFR